jgi:signal transduction histidine kinase
MVPDMADKPQRPSREETDAHLKLERDKKDQSLSDSTREQERQSDEVRDAARRRAADELAKARRREDERMWASEASTAEAAAIAAERLRADASLRDEYSQADAIAAHASHDRARVLAEMLAVEREATDRSLLLERAESEAIVSKRDEFLGMVSHDVRNELSGIALLAGKILTITGDDEPGRKIFRDAANIQRITFRMSRLIGDLLDVVSIDVGKFTIVLGDHDIRATVEDIVESFMPIASAKGLSLTVKIVGESLAAHFDRQRIQQVLGNLMTNALNHGSEGGEVAVGAERKVDQVWFTVADSGPGIAADQLETIFDRFSRGPHPAEKGLGLGLYIARRIVEAHGGRIWAESAPGRGSTFYFTLPTKSEG